MTAPTATISYDHITNDYTVTVSGDATNPLFTDSLWALNHAVQPISDGNGNTLAAAQGHRIAEQFLEDVAADTAPVVPGAPVITDIQVTHDTATITFTPPRDGGAAITNYKVWTGSAYVALSPADATGPTLVKGGFTPESTVGIKIRAVNSVGDGAESNVISKTFAAAP